MSFPRTMSSRPLAAAGVLAAAALAALSCGGGGSRDTTGPPDRGQLSVTCSLSSATVPAGSPTGVTVTAVVTRDGAPVAGQTVVFSTTLGAAISPDVVVSAADGRATATFRPSGQAGLAVVTTRVFGSLPQDQVGNTCSITVTGATDPLLSVSITSPSQLAGLTIFVTYNPSEVTLNSGGAQASGALSGQDCIPLADDDAGGTVQLDIACPTLRTVGGSVVATFDFENDGFGTIDATDFTVSCRGFVAEGGAEVATTCSKAVTQH